MAWDDRTAAPAEVIEAPHPALLNQDVEHHSVLVHRAPEVVQDAIDPQVHLIKVPDIARLRPASPQSPSEVGSELEALLADAL